MVSETVQRASLLGHLRAVVALAAAGVIAASLYVFQAQAAPTRGWWLLGVGLVLALLGQLGVDYPAPPPAPPPRAPSRRRRWLGIGLALAGAALWAFAVRTIGRHWAEGFDTAWAAWLGATALLAVGCDLACGVWPRPAARRWPLALLGVLAVLLAVAAWLRLGNIAEFPGEAAITQIEDLQVGAFGQSYLNGYRLRWEYLSSTWLAALGIVFGGPTQTAVRVPFAVVSVVKLVPIFVWLRLLVGTGGALAGTALLAVSFWDVVLSRIPNNHNVLVVAIAFALLAGPVRRGRPSAYVGLGFLGGYILHEYIAYRPLVLWAVLGATWWSLAQRGASWLARLGRPLLVVALIATMIAPLFLTRLSGGHWREYTDGWARAHGQTSYYNPKDTWEQSLARRMARAEKTAELFLWRGDTSPVRNRGMAPLVDPVTTALLVLGIAGALVHPLRPVLVLTLAGGVVHVLGTLVLTGNFDVARVGGAAGYVYVLAGAGAAGVVAALGAAWGRAGRRLGWALVAAAVAWAAWWNVTHLQAFWRAPEVRRAHRNNLAYLTIWLRNHLAAGERVLGVAPHHPFVIRGHDGIWLLGTRPEGEVFGDVQTALRAWPADGGTTLLVLFVERNTDDVAAYLAWLAPELTFTFDRDPLDLGAEVAWARLDGRPPGLAQRLAAAACRGAEAEFALVGAQDREVLAQERVIIPFVDRSVWPDSLLQHVYRVGPSRLRLRVEATFTVTTGGFYAFALDGYGGQVALKVDGRHRSAPGVLQLELAPGRHTLSVEGDFALITPSVSLRWSGPDTGNRQELMPFYRVAVPSADCPPAPEEEVAHAP